MDGPTDMRWKRTVDHPVGRFGLPNELSLVLEENVLVGSLHKVPLYSDVCKYGQGALRMSEGIRCDGHLWSIVKLCLEESQSELEVLNDVIVIGAPFVMLYDATT